jgi:hypothetical protein
MDGCREAKKGQSTDGDSTGAEAELPTSESNTPLFRYQAVSHSINCIALHCEVNSLSRLLDRWDA